MQNSNKYDYIIAGAGCAGLSLLVRLVNSGQLADKKVLLLDNREKTGTDRTWCFWETSPGYFDKLVYKKWDAISFKSESFSKTYDISPYQYKMIRGVDFYTYCFDLIKAHKNITVLQATVEDLSGKKGDTWVQCGDSKYYADYIFSSILFQKPPLRRREYLLLQHFKGWVIKTKQDVFDTGTAVFMDFRTSQQHGATFIYVMPLATNRALVEYTLFTPALLKQEEYEAGLRDYLQHYYPSAEYIIENEEFGIIPMTNHPFPPATENIIYIGTAGGQTKASTGYTFQFIQQHSNLLAEALTNGRRPQSAAQTSRKFALYDSILLNVLATAKLPGHQVFTHLFKKSTPQQIFRFLDNKTTIAEDLRIISSLPTLPFLKAGIEQVF